MGSQDDGKTTASRATWLTRTGGDGGDGEVLALVVAWSSTEPGRVGEVAVLDKGDRLFGRGAALAEDAFPRLRFGRHRPGRPFQPGPPFAGPRLSRSQLRVAARPGALAVERLGRCPMFVNGAPLDAGAVRPGDTLTLEDELVLVCVARPLDLAGAEVDAGFAFGKADAHGLVGESAAAWTLREEVSFAARRASHVLLLGPSGAGKELAAQAIHRLSPRARGPFVARNAATLPGQIVDAELFGHAKNYPNAGMPERLGLLGQADGGTLFLDEIGELPAELQAHLLRAMDAGGEYHRLGESQGRRADVRVIGATNRPETAIKHDLSARFGLRVHAPGLDARREDVPLLARHLLACAAADDVDLARRFGEIEDGAFEPRIDPRLVDRLIRHDYTQHVRELDALLLLAMSKSRRGFIELGREVDERLGGRALAGAPKSTELTKERIEEVLEAHGGSQERAYRELGLKNRDVLYRLIKKYGIQTRK